MRRAPLALLASLLAAVLVYGVHASALPRADLPARVHEALRELDADNAVTGVLLGFRAYDTLLEIAVLLFACTGAVVVRGALPPQRVDPYRDPVVDALLRFLLPLLLLVAAWLLWAGKSLPGGAFQAGAVLAATGVLLTLAGRRRAIDLAHRSMRFALVAGLAVFLAIGAGVTLAGTPWLGYPPGTSGVLILAIESVLTISIAASLYTLYASGPGDAADARASAHGRDPLDDLERTALQHEPPR